MARTKGSRVLRAALKTAHAWQEEREHAHEAMMDEWQEAFEQDLTQFVSWDMLLELDFSLEMSVREYEDPPFERAVAMGEFNFSGTKFTLRRLNGKAAWILEEERPWNAPTVWDNRGRHIIADANLQHRLVLLFERYNSEGQRWGE